MEYRSPLAGEDMPRKPLDSLEAANAPGIAGDVGRGREASPGCPTASDALIAALPTTGGQCPERTRPSADAGPAGRPRGPPEGPSGRPPARRLPAGLTGFCAHHPAPLGLGWWCFISVRYFADAKKRGYDAGMSFAILRIQKEHNRAGVASRAAHNLRQHSAAPRADAERSAKNKTIGAQTVPDVLAALDARLAALPKPPQKNAVLVVELMLAASPEWFTGGGKPGRFANEALEWAYAKFGKENILTASLHRDEKTPHLQILLTPIVEKKGVAKLRASHYFDGPSKMRDLQTEFAAHVEKLGLRRGIERKPGEPIKRHTTLKEYYKLVEQIVERAKKAYQAPAVPALPARGMLGRVSDDDWKALADSLAKHGAEVARLQAEAIAGRLFMDSSVGTEVGERLRLAREAAKKAQEEARRGQGEGGEHPATDPGPRSGHGALTGPIRGPEGADGKARRRDRAAGRAARHWPPGSAPGPARRGDRRAATSTRRVRRLSLHKVTWRFIMWA